MAEIVYLNGSLVPRSQARVSVFDQGFLYGYGLFETMRAYKGRVFLLDRHIQRLLDAAEAIGFSHELKGIDLGRACRETLLANSLQSARLRLTVSRGEVDGFPGTGVRATPTVLVTAGNYIPLSAEIYQRGYRVCISSLCRCRRSIISGIKSTNYLVNLLARKEADAAGFNEALLLNESGFIAEGSASNIFFVKAGGLVTPSLESGILPGITRQAVIELADRLGISVSESEVSPAEIEQSDEAFLTNSVMEIMPLAAVDNCGQTLNIGSGKPGSLTMQLTEAYREMVERETGA